MKQQWTGERLETFITDETMLEHLHRYAIAMEYVKGKKVLDIACGEGYGANLLAQAAAHVTAVDIDDSTIKKASNKYTATNIIFKTGSALKIPAEDSSFDIITCFETLEHIDRHDEMLTELKRVLAPEGILLISTPEKLNYSDNTGYINPFHKKELYGEEFKKLVRNYFPHTLFYQQISLIGSLLLDEQHSGFRKIYKGAYENIAQTSEIPNKYWLAVASNIPLSPGHSSIFHNNNSIENIINNQTEMVQKTSTYRLGKFLLSPIKLLLSFFKK